MYIHIIFCSITLTFVHDSLLSTGLLAGGAIGAEDVKTNEKVQVAVAGKGKYTYIKKLISGISIVIWNVSFMLRYNKKLVF